MLGRKPKKQPEPAQRSRRPVNPSQARSAFSYYASRMPDATARRLEQQRTEQAEPATKKRRTLAWAAILPLWLLAVVAIVCLVKLLFLGTDPKVIILGKSQVTSTYLQSADTYEAAAQKLLAGSITNRTKITANLDGTAAALKTQFPELQAVSVALPLIGNRPIVYAAVAQPSAVLQSGAGSFALNKSGLVLAKITEQPAGVPVIVDQSQGTPVPGKQYLPGSTIAFVQTLAYQMNAAKLQVSAYVLPANAPYELDMRLEGQSFVVRYSLVTDVLTQSGATVATLQQLSTTLPATYLDVRVPGRVYYK